MQIMDMFTENNIKLIKKNSLLCCIILFVWTPTFGQSLIIDLGKYSRFCGVVFTEEYKVPFKLEAKGRFTPSKKDIVLAENILVEETHYSKRELRKFRRQYVGYINNEGDRIININLLKTFGSRKKDDLYYYDRENEYIVGFGEIFEKNTDYQEINLSKLKVEEKD